MPQIVEEKERVEERRLCRLMEQIEAPVGNDTKSRTMEWALFALSHLQAGDCPPDHPDYRLLMRILAEEQAQMEQSSQKEREHKEWKPSLARQLELRLDPPLEISATLRIRMSREGWRWSGKRGAWWAWEDQTTKETHKELQSRQGSLV